MKLNEIKEPGFYVEINDQEHRKTIYEVFVNTDKKWLKENPEQTLLLDTWIYDYTFPFIDKDPIKIYASRLIVIPIEHADSIEVIKVCSKYKRGARDYILEEDKPGYKQLLQDLIEQMKNDIEIYEHGTHDNTDFICTIRDYLRMMGEEC